MVKICSFDVGIAHLAYCVLIKKESGFEILKWDNINLMADKKTCGAELKSGNICQKIASKYIDNKNNIQYFCGTHGRIINNTNNICNICNKKSKYKFMDKYYCEAHKIKIKNIINKPISKNIQNLAVKLYEKLDLIPELLAVDQVLIENQPSLINPTMKTMSALIFAYFILNGVIKNNQIKSVKFISPLRKLDIPEKILSELNLELKPVNNKNKKYLERKNLSILYTKYLLKNNNNKDMVDYLEKFKKQDDLSDAFLQGFTAKL